MLYLNIRQTQAQIGLHTQLGQLTAHYTPAQLHTEGRQAQSNMGWTQPTLEMDSYQSRHAYGYSSHADFAREHGQQGLSDLKQATASHSEAAWHNIDYAARPDSGEPAAIYDRELSSIINRQRRIVAELIPAPTIKITPGEVRGTPDVGDVTVRADTQAFAATNFTPGSVEVYMRQKGEVHQWTTEGHYDIYA
jgi:hypothetical protein